MSDRIEIAGLSVRCVVGVHPHERTAPRELLLDLVLETDLSRAGRTDALADTIDYDFLVRTVKSRLEAMSPRLIETIAADAAQTALADHRVTAVSVTVHKPGAVPGTAGVAVTIRRSRP